MKSFKILILFLSFSLMALGTVKGVSAESNEWYKKFNIGGYGEMHMTDEKDDNGDHMDIHRYVIYLGYDFADWVKFNSEIEIEHAFVAEANAGGELELEQFYVDLHLNKNLNVRIGRMLAPVGILNTKHEPTTFNGVERPNFHKNVIPTTWWVDGIGVFGEINESLKYQVNITNGLDGSGFDTSGIRGGRLKERPGLHNPAISGRFDYAPDLEESDLNLGFSFFTGGANNENKKAGSVSGVNATILATDIQLSYKKFDFRGEYAFIDIDHADILKGKDVASEIVGFYVELGYHFLPDSFKKGKLANADAVIFARYDAYNTQSKMPAGTVRIAGKDINNITLGINFYPVENFVIKADYQLVDDETSASLNDILSLGIGFQF